MKTIPSHKGKKAEKVGMKYALQGTCYFLLFID
jgi:hypothetical protein